MNLKRAILRQYNRDYAKAICDELELADVDRRSLAAMQKVLARSRKATPEMLLAQLSEDEVKGVCDDLGLGSTGRRSKLVAALLAAADGTPDPAPATNHKPLTPATATMGKRKSATPPPATPLIPAEGS